MMPAMSRRTRVTAGLVTAGAWWMAALTGCGAKEKPAESPVTCPEGTVLSGESCLPASASAAKKPGDDDASQTTAKASTPSASPAGGGAADTEGGGGRTYDKEAVETQLKRAAKQVRGNCGLATDEDGNQNGPWGTTTAAVVLGRNGHVREVTVAAPYGGTPVGECIVNSFKKLVYPPYPGASDATVSWPVEVIKPK
jgi:hypothetical protein